MHDLIRELECRGYSPRLNRSGRAELTLPGARALITAEDGGFTVLLSSRDLFRAENVATIAGVLRVIGALTGVTLKPIEVPRFEEKRVSL